MSEIAQNEFNDKTNIKVVGVGGAGGNAVNRMIAEGLQNVEFVAVNTDAKDLLRSDADVKISLSDKSSRGLGAGADRSVEPRRPRTTSRISKRRLGVPTWCSSPAARAVAPVLAPARSSLVRLINRVLSPSRLLLVRSASRPSAFRFRRIRHRQPAQGSRRADRHSERSPARAFRPFHRHH